MGEQTVPDDLLTRWQTETEGVTRLLYEPPEQMAEGSDEVTPGLITAFAKRGRTALPNLINSLDAADIEIQSVQVKEPDLEAVFLALTGRALRDRTRLSTIEMEKTGEQNTHDCPKRTVHAIS